jgi:hypothetical protein
VPKSKPTQVIVHRIELQDKEREMMETLIAGKTIESVGKGAYHLGIVMVGGVAVYVVWWTLDSMYGWLGKAGDWWDIRKANVKAVVDDPENNPHTNIFGLPGWGIWEGVL